MLSNCKLFIFIVEHLLTLKRDLTNLEFTQIPMTLNDLRKLKNLYV